MAGVWKAGTSVVWGGSSGRAAGGDQGRPAGTEMEWAEEAEEHRDSRVMGKPMRD